MNIHDSEKIAGILEQLNYTPCQEASQADIVVFNTCCIRETAEKKIYGHLGQLKKLKAKKPHLIVAVCGCMSQQDGVAQTLRQKYPFVDIVLGTANLVLLKQAVLEAQQKRTFVNTQFFNCAEEEFFQRRTSFPNAWVNINYGCDNFCTYCIVPYVRGREHSRPPQDVLTEVASLVEEGYKEITLLGQNVNSYGKEFADDINFAYLLRQIGQLPGKFRLRFMTSHPKDLSDDIIDAIAQYPNICNNIHLPVQSGSTEILRKMNRKYTREDYLSLVQRIRQKLPDVGITTDIMVGFPEETEENFADTLSLVEQVQFSSAFCFVYSPRKGTPACSMPQVPDEVKKSRIVRLNACQNKVTKAISAQMVGKKYEVLVEGKQFHYPNTMCGRTESGRLVNFECSEDLIGKFVTVQIETAKSATLWGRVTED